jgi:hypothetical protein
MYSYMIIIDDTTENICIYILMYICIYKETYGADFFTPSFIICISKHLHHHKGGSTTANQISILSGGAVTMLQGGVKGVIVRDAKRDAPGVINIKSLVAVDSSIGSNIDDNYPEVLEALEEFRDCQEVEEVVLENVTSSQRKAYHTILSEKFPGIAHEGRGKAFRLLYVFVWMDGCIYIYIYI